MEAKARNPDSEGISTKRTFRANAADGTRPVAPGRSSRSSGWGRVAIDGLTREVRDFTVAAGSLTRQSPIVSIGRPQPAGSMSAFADLALIEPARPAYDRR